MPSSNPKLTVIIPCRDEADCIEDCLQSVVTQESPGCEVEVIVADGRSEDATREILARFAARHPGLRIVDNPQRIASTGLNAAIAQATGDIIVRLDAHTEYAPDYLRQCRAVLQQTGADNVGGPARTRPRTFWECAIAAAYHSGFAAGGARFHNENYEGYVDTVTYGCWRRTTFDRFGLFDEGLVRNQDDEHNLRITRGGGKVWQSPRIRSYYRPRGSIAALFQQYSQYGYWKVRVIRKHRLPASPRHLVPGGFVLSLLVLGLLSLFFPLARWLLALTAALYSLCTVFASVAAARKSSWTLLPALPFVFACYHLAYGYGFLRGILAELVPSKKTSSSFSQLTRENSRATKT